MDLSPEGFQHVDEIVELFFAYVEMLRGEGVKQWVFQECSALAGIGFRFRENEQPSSAVVKIVGNLCHYPITDCLSGPFLSPDYKPELIERVLEKVKPENMVVSIQPLY